MKSHCLVTYASKYGSTGEMAERVRDVLRREGLSADLLPVDQVATLTPYSAVILGSAVYMGRWRKEAINFLEANENKLARRDVWLFSSGPTGTGDPEKLLDGWEFPAGQQDSAEQHQLGHAAVAAQQFEAGRQYDHRHRDRQPLAQRQDLGGYVTTRCDAGCVHAAASVARVFFT